MNLLLIEPGELDARGEIVLADRRADHIRHVLHGRAGQSLRVGLLNGPMGTGMIRALDGDAVTLRCVFSGALPAVPPVDLLLALPRPKVMRRLWAPLAAMGIGRILITNAEKVERYYFDSHVLDPAVYTGEVRLGLEQAMDTRMPEITIHPQFKPLIEDQLAEWGSDATRLVAHTNSPMRVSDALGACRPHRVLMAVGPEGGWSEYEVELLTGHGFTPVGIGPRILRTDTACISLLALAHDALGHFEEFHRRVTD